MSKVRTKPNQVLPPADTDYFSFQLYVRALAGGIAGLAGGLAMLLFQVAAYALLDQDPLMPVRLVGVALMGDSALLPSSYFWPIVTGVLVSAGMSAFLGAIFSTLLPPVEHRRSDVLWAFFYGAVIAAVMWFLLLPAGLNIALLVRMPRDIFFIAHLVFGGVLGFLLPRIESRLMRREFEDRVPDLVVPKLTEDEKLSEQARVG